MPFISTLGSISLFGFGLSSDIASAGIDNGLVTALYFNNTIDNDWSTAGNWYRDSNTTTAGYIPDGNDTVTILQDCTANVDTWTKPASILIVGAKTLTLTAHPVTQNCAPPVIVDIPIEGSNPQVTGYLNYTGHISITA